MNSTASTVQISWAASASIFKLSQRFIGTIVYAQFLDPFVLDPCVVSMPCPNNPDNSFK